MQDHRRSDSDSPALPSSPSVLSNLHFFVQSQVNSFSTADEGSTDSQSSASSTSDSSSYTRSPSLSASSDDDLAQNQDEDLEAIEVLNALASFESIGSSGGSDEASTLSGSFYLDQPLSPVLEVEEPLKEPPGSTDDEVFTRSSKGSASELDSASMEAFASSRGESLTEEETDSASVINVTLSVYEDAGSDEMIVKEDTVVIDAHEESSTGSDSPVLVSNDDEILDQANGDDLNSGSPTEPSSTENTGDHDMVVINAAADSEGSLSGEETVIIGSETSEEVHMEDTVVVVTEEDISDDVSELEKDAYAEAIKAVELNIPDEIKTESITELTKEVDIQNPEASAAEATTIEGDSDDLSDTEKADVSDDVESDKSDTHDESEDAPKEEAEDVEISSESSVPQIAAMEDDTDTDTLINLAIEDDDSPPTEETAPSPTESASTGSGTLEGFEFVSKEELEVLSVSTSSPTAAASPVTASSPIDASSPVTASSPTISDEEIVKNTMIVIKLVNGKNEYEKVLPLELEVEDSESKRLSKRKRSELLETPPPSPEDDPVLQEMIESFKVDEILKVMDEPGVLDTSSLLNSECGEARSACVVPSRPSHEKIITLDQPNSYDETFDIETPQSPLINKIDEMIETLKVDVDLTLCPCSSLKACVIL